REGRGSPGPRIGRAPGLEAPPGDHRHGRAAQAGPGQAGPPGVPRAPGSGLPAGHPPGRLIMERAIAPRILALVRGNAGPLRTAAGCDPDAPLGEGGFWLDSVSLLEVVVACEEEFGVVFEPETDLRAEHLRSARTLSEVVRARSGG